MSCFCSCHNDYETSSKCSLNKVQMIVAVMISTCIKEVCIHITAVMFLKLATLVVSEMLLVLGSSTSGHFFQCRDRNNLYFSSKYKRFLRFPKCFHIGFT